MEPMSKALNFAEVVEECVEPAACEPAVSAVASIFAMTASCNIPGAVQHSRGGVRLSAGG
jgi:hypothetical protein